MVKPYYRTTRRRPAHRRHSQLWLRRAAEATRVAYAHALACLVARIAKVAGVRLALPPLTPAPYGMPWEIAWVRLLAAAMPLGREGRLPADLVWFVIAGEPIRQAADLRRLLQLCQQQAFSVAEPAQWWQQEIVAALGQHAVSVESLLADAAGKRCSPARPAPRTPRRHALRPASGEARVIPTSATVFSAHSTACDDRSSY